MNNSKQLTYGEPLDYLQEPTIIANKISNVVPISYDGFLEKYVVCSITDASYMLVRTDGGDMLIPRNCENKYLLVDAIID